MRLELVLAWSEWFWNHGKFYSVQGVINIINEDYNGFAWEE